MLQFGLDATDTITVPAPRLQPNPVGFAMFCNPLSHIAPLLVPFNLLYLSVFFVEHS